MEEGKRVYKFYGKPGEDFHLWTARTEAALEAKEVLEVVTADIMSSVDISDELVKKISKARAIIIQGLGDRPLRLCLSVKTDPYKMWNKLRDRYAVSNTATKVQLQTRLSSMSYKDQSMQDYVDTFEEIFNRLAAMQSDIGEDLQVAMLLASVGDKIKSPFGYLIASMQAVQESLDWETATANLIQEYEDHTTRSGANKNPKNVDAGQALVATGSKKSSQKYSKYIQKPEKRRCFICQKVGHIARNCYQKGKKDGKQKGLYEKPIGESSLEPETAHPAQLLLAVEQGDVSPRGSAFCHACLKNGHTFECCRSSYDELAEYQNHFDCDEDYLWSARDEKNGSEQNETDFLLDSGASDHMISCEDWLRNVRTIEPRAIVLGDGNRVYGESKGTLALQTFIGCPGDLYERKIILRDVLCVPSLRSNLISCSRLCQDDYRINIRKSNCNGVRENVVQFEGRMERGVYKISAVPICEESVLQAASTANNHDHGDYDDGIIPRNLSLWHARFGHANIESLKELSRKNVVQGLRFERDNVKHGFCRGCIEGKQTRETLRKNKSRSMERCAVIHSDICGPMSIESFSGSKYFVSFIDEYSGYTVVVPVQRKSDVLAEFRRYEAWIERKYDCRIKRLHSDNGGEYIAMKAYLRQQGIEQTTSPSYSPNQNAIAERANRTIVECARSMLQNASLPRRFWAEAVVHAAKIRNIFLCPKNREITSYEMMTGRKPTVSYLRVFGCLGWRHIPKDLRRKLDSKSEPGVVIGCMENSLYKLWIPERNTAVISRDVKIDEKTFPARDWGDKWINGTTPHVIGDGNVDSDAENLGQQSARAPANLAGSRTERDRIERAPTVTGRADPDTRGASEEGIESVPLSDGQIESLTYYPLGSSRDLTVDEQVDDRDINDGSDPVPSSEDVESTRRYPGRDRRQTLFYDPSTAAIAWSTSMGNESECEPRTVSEALGRDDANEWRKAIESELESHKVHRTWEVVARRENVKPLSTRFVFLRKCDENGSIVRHKAGLVVRVFLQRNVDQTFAPVVDFTTVRVCLTIAIQRGYSVHQLDVKTAFLHGDINQEVYINSPDGLELCRPDQMLKLNKGLYGLRQAPRLWYDKWKTVMKRLGFMTMQSDECLFRRGDVWLLVYVDDILLIGEHDSVLDKIKKELSEHIDIKDLGVLHSFLGVLFFRDDQCAWLSQKHYIPSVLKRFGMFDCKAVSTPMCHSMLKDSIDDKSSLEHKETYQELIGCLLFIATRTRPDIFAAVSFFCRYTSSPSQTHWRGLQRIIRYLKGSEDYCLKMFKHGDGTLRVFCDADWGSDRADRKSVSGMLFQVDGTSVSWSSQKQSTVALSTTEAEFLELSDAAKLVIWLRGLLRELNCVQMNATKVLEDNQGAVVWSTEGVRHAKHVSIRRNFVKDLVEQEQISIQYCPTQVMIADILTKPLLKVTFFKYREGMGILRMTR